MGEIPEHLLKRAQKRKEELAAQAAAQGEPAQDAQPQNTQAQPTPEPVAQEQAPPPVRTGLAAKVPEHLFKRSQARRAALSGDSSASTSAQAPSAPAPGAPVAGAPTMQGPDGHTHRLLTVVKSGSIQQTKSEAQDKVHTWPHLLSIEFGAMVIVTAGLVVFSMFARAPLLGLADLNQTPNPSKAPWYFMGLQELLTMYHPMIAGVTIPGVALVILALTPYFDRNLSNKPSDRKFAIVAMTIFLIFWATLVIIGSFFRGQGFNFIFPMKDGVFFEL